MSDIGDVIALYEIISLIKDSSLNKVSCSFRCSPIVVDALKEYACEHNMSFSSLVDKIVSDFYDENLKGSD